MTARLNVKNHDCAGLREQLKALGCPAFRGTQVFQWLWRRRAESFAEMANLPAKLRDSLEAGAELPQLELDTCQQARDGTRKILVRLPDGEKVECVLIPDRERRTLCVSTQVGCAMGCRFCRTATMGLKRHLEPWEIAEQVLLAERVLTDAGDHREVSGGKSSRSKVARRLTNLVFMGMGEPLHNIEGTLAAIRILTDPEGLDIAPRRITVSTVGLLDEARRVLAETDIRLAFSLNAPDNERRDDIMPVNKRWRIGEIIELVMGLDARDRDRVTFEYVVLAGFNDRPGDERILEDLLAPLGRHFRVNLIPFNAFEETEFQRPEPARVEAIRDHLRAGGVDAFIRRPRGDDILAACGQLALRKGASGSAAEIPV